MAGGPRLVSSQVVACPDIRLTAAEVGNAKAQLEKEEESLLRMKELIEQQLKVLQAETVTIQRLIATHSQPQQQQQQTGPAHSHSRDLEPQTSSGEDEGVNINTVSNPHAEPNRNQLPELNLDLDPGPTLSPSSDGALEECDSDEEQA